MAVAKIIFLFVAVLIGMPTAVKVFYKQEVTWANFLYLAIGIVGFLVIQFELYK